MGFEPYQYYMNINTGTIHIVADFPKPKSNGFVQCGRFATHSLTRMFGPTVLDGLVRNHCELCKKCRQVIGSEN